ncbi:MAG TPA: TonB-dependent receptor, partial [Gemmatimonadaceae bacterium]
MSLLAVRSAAAQQGSSIRGTVTATDGGAPIFGARIAIQTPERIAISDERGTYILRDIPAGEYTVRITAIGRKPDSSRVVVQSGATATTNFALKDGSLLLSSVVVSATRTPVEASKVAATVNVLTPEQVRQSPSRESQDMLREFTSVELPRTSSLVGGTAQIVSIRGVDEGRTVVLADGFPINDAWGEWIDWGRMPKAMLDRVEVVEGGTSSLYGNGAMGGLISFFTRPLAPGQMSMQVDGGSRDARHGYIAAGLPIFRGLTANVFGDYQEKGGYQVVDEIRDTSSRSAGVIDIPSQVIQRNAFARLNYAPSAKWSAFATGHLFGDSRNPGTPLSYANRDQRDLNFGLDYGSYATGQFSVRAFDGRQIEKQQSAAARTIARAAEDLSGRAVIPSHDWGASAVWSRSGLFGLETFNVGGDFRHYQGDYNETQFNTTGCPTAATCGDTARKVSSGGAQSLSGAFVQALISPVSPLHIDLSARVDRWDNTDGHAIATNVAPTAYPDSSKTAFSPRVGVKYQVFSKLGLHAAYYRAFRAPNLAELYRKSVSPTQITIPNPYLKAENAEGREAGFDFQPMEWVQLKGTWYVADYNNFNVPTALTGTAKPAECGTVATCRMRLNVNKSRSEGGEAYLALRP